MDSTRRVHYPAHLESMARLRPELPPIDIDTWFRKNCDPGIMAFLVDELRLTPEELAIESAIWREHTARGTPHFFPGVLEALAAYRAAGGRVAVVSHSETHIILGHYRGAAGTLAVEPDLVFGWDLGPDKRKPNPYPVHETVRLLGLEPRDVLVLDDLKPGIVMAQAAGVDAAGAGWAHDISSIREFMRQACVAYFGTVAEFAEFVLR